MADSKQTDSSFLGNIQEYISSNMSKYLRNFEKENEIRYENIPDLIENRPAPLENPTLAQAANNAYRTVPYIAGQVATSTAELVETVSEDPGIIVDAGKVVGNAIWNPQSVPMIEALASYYNIAYFDGSNANDFRSQEEIKEIQKPLNQWVDLKKEQYGSWDNFKRTLANAPENLVQDVAAFFGIKGAAAITVNNTIPNTTINEIVNKITPEPDLVPAMVTAGDSSTVAGQQTETLMPTVRRSFLGDNPPTYVEKIPEGRLKYRPIDNIQAREAGVDSNLLEFNSDGYAEKFKGEEIKIDSEGDLYIDNPDGYKEYVYTYSTMNKSVEFREPIIEFIMGNNFKVPKNGIKGSDFLKQLEKNPSIANTSIPKNLVDPDLRYSSSELATAITDKKFITKAELDTETPQFPTVQRQNTSAGFSGGREIEYFEIPLISSADSGEIFFAEQQHYDPETLVHVRGSIVEPELSTDYGLNTETFFNRITQDKDFLLVEEIQSDLVAQGYIKLGNREDEVFQKSLERFNKEIARGANTTSFNEKYDPVIKDIKKIIINAENEGVKIPYEPGSIEFEDVKMEELYDPFKHNRFREKVLNEGNLSLEDLNKHLEDMGVSQKGTTIRYILELIEVPNNPSAILGRDFAAIPIDAETGYPLNDPFPDFAVSKEYSNSVKVRNEKKADDIYDALLNFKSDNDLLNQRRKKELEEYRETSKKLEEYFIEKSNKLGSFVSENFPTPEGSKVQANDLETLYELFKSSGRDWDLDVKDMTGTTASKVILPPIRKNKQAVDEALKVIIAKAQQAGVSQIVIPPAERIALARSKKLNTNKGDRFYRTYVVDLEKSLKELEANYPVEITRNVKLPYAEYGQIVDGKRVPYEVNTEGTIIDISKLTEKYDVSMPRQFAEGGLNIQTIKLLDNQKLQRGAATLLGVKDESDQADAIARQWASDNEYSDSEEDTLRHILLGGFMQSVQGEGFGRVGKGIAGKLINVREGTDKESLIDIDNNNFGRQLRKELINKDKDSSVESFVEVAKNFVHNLRTGKEVRDVDGLRPRMSTAGQEKQTATGMSEGGSMARQMKMFEEGGIADDGMSRDPVSGNEIPSGSLAEEVRDDIPAQLSEGEYVVPADVVRFFGVKFFEDLRTKAKMGLQKMEQDGRIGGEPIDAPAVRSNTDDLSPEEQQLLQEIMAMEQPTEQPAGFAPGGLASGYSVPSGFNSLTDFVTSPTRVGKQFKTLGGSYIADGTTDTALEPVAPVVNKVCPPGQIFSEKSQMCIIDPNTYKNNDDDGGKTVIPEPEDWGDDIDWTYSEGMTGYVDSVLTPMDKGLQKGLQIGGAMAGGFLGLGVGLLPVADAMNDLSNARATSLIARAMGDTATADAIDAKISVYVEKAPAIATSWLGNWLSSGTSRANRLAREMGFDNLADAEANSQAFADKLGRLSEEEVKIRAKRQAAQITAAGVAPKTSGVDKNIVSAGVDKADATTAAIKAQYGGKMPTKVEEKAARAAGVDLLGNKLSKTEDQLTRADKVNRKVQIDKVIEEKKKSGQLDKDGRARGGRNKGGLIKKRKKK